MLRYVLAGFNSRNLRSMQTGCIGHFGLRLKTGLGF